MRSVDGSAVPDDIAAFSRRRLLPAAAIVVVYLATFLLLPRDGFWVCDNGAKFIQLQGIIRTDYRDYSIPWSGKEFDPTFSHQPLPEPFGYVVNDRLYCVYPPFFALVSSFPFRLLGFAGLYILPLAGGLLTLPAVWRLTGLLPAPRAAQPLALLLLGLATPIWFYSVTFWEHMPAACLATWSVYLCIQYLIHGGVRRLLFGAVFCGASIYFRDDLYLFGAVLVGVLLLYGRRRWRDAALFVLALAITLEPLWVFQWLALGHPLGHHFAPQSPLEAGFAGYLSERWPVARNILMNAHHTQWLSIVISVPAVLLWLAYPRAAPRAFRWLVVIIAGAALAGGLVVLGGHLFTERRVGWLLYSNGLFAASPVLLLAFVREKDPPGSERSARQHEKDQRIPRIVWLILSAYVLLYVLVAPEKTTQGAHWGCRYVLPVYPLMSALAAVTIARWWQAHAGRARRCKVLVIAAVVLSTVAQIYSLLLLHEKKSFCRTLNQVVGERPEEMVLANVWFITMDLSQCFYDQTMFLIKDREDSVRLSSVLGRAGQEKVLLILWHDKERGAPAGSQILQDGSLGFTSVQLVSVPLGQ